jgi:hypothetical protein
MVIGVMRFRACQKRLGRNASQATYEVRGGEGESYGGGK